MESANDYEDVSELVWTQYELETIYYDYRIHPEASSRINSIVERLYANKR